MAEHKKTFSEKGNKNKDVYTIGHSNHSLQYFISLLLKYEIEILVDIRSNPFSRHVPHFNQYFLQRELERMGIKYLYLGRELGGRPREPEFYNKADGKVSYSRIAETLMFKKAINFLLKVIRSSKTALLCGEEDPTSCHRRLLVGRVLINQGINVFHIRGDGRLDTEESLKNVKSKFSNRFQQLKLF